MYLHIILFASKELVHNNNTLSKFCQGQTLVDNLGRSGVNPRERRTEQTVKNSFRNKPGPLVLQHHLP